jgi:toxin ParE1/3/4
MRKILKRPLARQDIKSIWSYSFEQWGAAQAERYIKALEKTLVELAQAPMHGTAVTHPYPGLRQYRYKKHLIIYLHTATTLDIVRVLHERMDIARHTLQ